MISSVDHYKNLELPFEASMLEVKRAFHRLAKSCHPDLHPQNTVAEARFKQINESYRILSDPQLRQAYDQRVKRPRPQKKAAPERGNDVVIAHSIELGILLLGGSTVVQFERTVPCDACRDEVLKGRTLSCPSCSGLGHRKAAGPLPFKRRCERCAGKGRIPEHSCRHCQGRGASKSAATVEIPIPAGTFCTERICVKGEGSQGRFGGPPGDLFVEVTTPNSAMLSKRGDDLLLFRTVKLSTLLLGTQLELPEFGQGLRVRIPPLSKPESLLRIGERGFLNPKKNKRGDLLVQLKVQMPQKMSQEDVALVRQLMERNDEF